MTLTELKRLVAGAYTVVAEGRDGAGRICKADLPNGDQERVVAVILERALANTPPDVLCQALLEFEALRGWNTR